MDNILKTENQELRLTIDQVTALSTTLTSILVQGETGTGKTELAERIHKFSGATGQFVVVNCGEIQDSLFEAQMFGTKKGSFTGAVKDEKGLVTLSNDGTLCLDEIQNLTDKGQQALLRVLDRKVVRPVGGKVEESVSFRLIATCNIDLQARILEGRFRQDLYFRVCEHIATMPPLRERTEDLGTITIDIQKGIQKERKIPIKELTPDAWEAIYGYDWRGNIRELKNVLMTGTIKAGKSSRITSKNLFNKPILESMAKKYGIFEVLGFTKEAYPTMSTVMDKVKYLYIRRLMIEANGNVSEACRLGSMTRTSLYQYARRLKIDLKDF